MLKTRKYILTVVLLVFGSIVASAQTFNGTGFTFVDNGGSFACGQIVVSGITSNVTVTSATLRGLSHTWVGDTVTTLVPPGGVPGTNGISIASPPDAESANYLGDYTFIDTASATIDETAGPLTGNIPPGNYKASDYGDGTNPGPVVAITTTFGTLTPAQANGNWRICGADFATGDTGAATSSTLVLLSSAPTTFPRSDFNGDGKTDLSVFRPSSTSWEIRSSAGGDSTRIFGLATDVITPSDFDGDNKTDLAVFRAVATPGSPDFYVLKSSDSTVTGVEWGTTGDTPVVTDYDGDNKDDYAIWRGTTGDFYVLQSQSNSIRHYKFGTAGDKPVSGYYAGADAKADFAVYRPSTGAWWIADSVSNAVTMTLWGVSTDIPVFADYDGDAKDDIAVFRPSDGTWYIRNSQTSTNSYIPFGVSGDVPVPGDYDGDGKYDQAVYRGGTWYMRRSTSGFALDFFGLATDRPTPRWYLPQ
jgi:hypothetical protein